MAGLSTYAQQKILDHMVGKASWTMPTAYVAGYTAAPSDAGGGTECSYTGYTRATTSASDWGSASGTTATNAAVIALGGCTAGTATITHFGVFDALSGGNLIGWAPLGASLIVNPGVTPQFAVGALVRTID
jgi:hypothetical protein